MKTETEYVKTHQDVDGDEVQQKRVVSREENVDGKQKAANIVYVFVGIISGIIAIRFLLLLFGANSQNTIAQIIYGISEPFVAPFYGLFGNPYSIDGVRFEFESLIAIVFVTLIGWAIVRLLTIDRPQNHDI